MCQVTKQSTWEKPTLFGEKEPPTNAGDAALFDKDMLVGYGCHWNPHEVHGRERTIVLGLKLWQ